MTETLKKLTPEQVEIIKQYSTEEEIEKLFLRLNYNFGGGEVLSFKQTESFFSNYMHKNENLDMLNIFIDTIRILRLVGQNENDVLGLDESAVIKLHNALSSEYLNVIDEAKSIEYTDSVSPFNHLTGDYGHIKIELISSLTELQHEGASMQHCIATYDDIIIRKQYIGFRVHNKFNQERLTLGCHRDVSSNKLYFNQLKGLGNYPAKKDSCLAVINFCKQKEIIIPESELHDLLPAFQN